MNGAACATIGEITEYEELQIFGLSGKQIMVRLLGDLKEAWQKPLRW